jgi:glucokinase
MSELDELNINTIVDCCEIGDRMAIETFRRVGSMLGVGLANYASVINPEAIILTGDMMVAGKWLLKPMRQAFDEHVFRNIRNKVKIFASRLSYGGSSDVLGASALAWHVKEYSLFK